MDVTFREAVVTWKEWSVHLRRYAGAVAISVRVMVVCWRECEVGRLRNLIGRANANVRFRAYLIGEGRNSVRCFSHLQLSQHCNYVFYDSFFLGESHWK
jgi:hypothetical protein